MWFIETIYERVRYEWIYIILAMTPLTLRFPLPQYRSCGTWTEGVKILEPFSYSTIQSLNTSRHKGFQKSDLETFRVREGVDEGLENRLGVAEDYSAEVIVVVIGFR
jgi:hypothetical protein